VSEIGYGPLERIDGPLPVPPPYGLLAAAAAPATGVRIVVDVEEEGTVDLNDLSSTGETMDEAIARLKREGILPASAGDYRWLNGVEVYPYPPDVPGLYEPCGSNVGTAGTKTFGSDLAHPRFSAVTIYVAETCTSYKVWNQEQFKARAVTALTAVQSHGVARQLLLGVGDPENPYLADAAGDCQFPNGDAVTNALNGLALLEQAIGNTGKLGLIHCSPQFASALRERFAVDNRGGVIRTINGNILIADNGYAAGSTPHGHPGPSGTEEWIYATGPVDVRLSEIFVLPEKVSEALDRGTPNSATTGRPNSITYRAERYALPIWDTELQVAVRVDRCQSGCSA
jgi:hypothetical protein